MTSNILRCTVYGFECEAFGLGFADANGARFEVRGTRFEAWSFQLTGMMLPTVLVAFMAEPDPALPGKHLIVIAT
jgi:hypothetical protein